MLGKYFAYCLSRKIIFFSVLVNIKQYRNIQHYFVPPAFSTSFES